jgi:hypothetical protein
MKKLFFYVLGALFLFASCQSDELESDALVQENDVILMKAIEAYSNYQSKTDWSQASKSPNANQVTKKWTMHYSTGTVAVVPNPDACGDFDAPNLELQIDGYGRGSLFGNFTFTNRACFDPELGFLSDLLGVGTTAAGDQFYFVLESSIPDPEPNDNFVTQRWNIRGGSEGGRFERASGWLEIYGDNTQSGSVFVGWGEFTY